MIIMSDCDGVLADFVGGLCSELAARGFSRTAEEFKHWDLSLTLSPEELRAMHDIMSAPGFCHSLPWYEGARKFLSELALLGEAHALTAPFRNGASWMHERMSWLSSELPVDRVHFVSGKYKHLVRAHVLIEDHPKTGHDWCEANPDGVAILIDRPWNRAGASEWHAHRNMYRAESFERALQIVEGLS